MMLRELAPAFSALLPWTRYFEIDSSVAAARFAVWATIPLKYLSGENRSYPAIYILDGNMTVPQTAAFHLLESDPVHPIQPFVLFGVGYPAAQASRQLALRARDLIPRGEPLPGGADPKSLRRLVERGLLDEAGAELYLANLRAPAADRFLAFLTNELHPQLCRLFRIEAQSAGLYGYSYGGLFCLAAALERSALFRRIGAGSPAIAPQVSQIFARYRAQYEAAADHSGRMLHVTVCETELTANSYYRTLVGAGTAELLALAQSHPLNALRLSSCVIPRETHATGLLPSWHSFLRACYPAAPREARR